MQPLIRYTYGLGEQNSDQQSNYHLYLEIIQEIESNPALISPYYLGDSIEENCFIP